MSLSTTRDALAGGGRGSKLSVKVEGETIPLKSTIEIKNRVHHRPLPIQEAAAQLWVSQTPRLVRAYHRQGVFQNPTVEDVTADIARWEKSNQAQLRKLASLIGKILAVVKERCKGGNDVLKYDALRDSLVVSEVEDKKMLPKDLYCKWNCTDNSRVGTSKSSVKGGPPDTQAPAQV